MKFLVVDDNPDDRELIIQELTGSLGDVEYIEVIRRADFERAMDRGGFDLVLTDYRLNWTDGISILKQSKKRHPHIPVIMITDTGSEEVAVQAMKAGLSDYVLKSYLFQLPMAVKETLEKERLRKEYEAAQEALREAHLQLEKRVEERTAELLRTNKQLKREIEERTRAEKELKQKTIEAEEASRAKSHFLSTISHELRTPLNAIIGYTQLLEEGLYGPVPENQMIPKEGIRRNANDQLKLVNDLLDLTKIESKTLTVDLGEVDLSKLIEEVYLGIRPLFEKKALHVKRHIENDLPTIESDPYKIRQIITNLLANALKFTEEGGVAISIRKLPRHPGVEIVIQDTGIGIPPEELPKIFNAFHQVDGTITREYGGVGLGLAIVKELVSLLKGEIGVESAVGKGTTFILSLPLGLTR